MAFGATFGPLHRRAAVENRAAPFHGVTVGFMIIHGCGAVVGSAPSNTAPFVETGAEERANLGSRHSCLAEGDTVDPNQKTMMVEGFVAAFASKSSRRRKVRNSPPGGVGGRPPEAEHWHASSTKSGAGACRRSTW